MFTGSIVALVTPMNSNGSIDLISLKKLINYHIISGTTAILAVGTTGESSTLNNKEHIRTIMHILEFSENKIPIIAGTGSNSTNEAIYLTKSLNDSGVIGYLSVTPYYNKPSQEGIYKHYKQIASNTNLPLILYNVPIRTGSDLLPETIAKLAEIQNIIGIKEASGNLNRVSQIKNLVNENFILLSGDDASALDFMLLGGKGVISVTANIAAKEMAELCEMVAKEKFLYARQLNKKLIKLHQNLFIEPNPSPVKWACKYLGLIKNDYLRLPMTSLSFHGKNIVKKALVNNGLFKRIYK